MPEFVPPPPELSEAEKKALLASVQVSQASSQNKEVRLPSRHAQISRFA